MSYFTSKDSSQFKTCLCRDIWMMLVVIGALLSLTQVRLKKIPLTNIAAILLEVCGESQRQTVTTPAFYLPLQQLRHLCQAEKWPTDHMTHVFLELVDTLEKCARRYRCFCLKYHNQKKRRVDARTGVRRILPETPGKLRSQRYERAGQLTFRPKWRYRRSKNCPRLLNIKNTKIANKEATTTLPIINNNKLIIRGWKASASSRSTAAKWIILADYNRFEDWFDHQY